MWNWFDGIFLYKVHKVRVDFFFYGACVYIDEKSWLKRMSER